MDATASAPEVSVVLNSYNQGEYLADAIESVLAQEGATFELLLTDNGSTDGSAEIARRYESDPRVRLFLHEGNEPVSRRFNQAIEAARGTYVAFLYSDDYFLPGKLQHQVRVLQSNPGFGVVYGPALNESVESGDRWTREVIEVRGDGLRAVLDPPGTHGRPDMSSPMALRQCFVDFPFDEDLFAEGEVIFLHIASKYPLLHSPEPTVVLRDHDSNAGKALRRNCNMTRSSLRRLRGYQHLSEVEVTAVEKFEAKLCLSYGWQSARLMPDQRWTRRCLRDAVRLDRGVLLKPKLYGGFALSLLPARLRARINGLGHRLRDSGREAIYLEDYAGIEDGERL